MNRLSALLFAMIGFFSCCTLVHAQPTRKIWGFELCTSSETVQSTIKELKNKNILEKPFVGQDFFSQATSMHAFITDSAKFPWLTNHPNFIQFKFDKNEKLIDIIFSFPGKKFIPKNQLDSLIADMEKIYNQKAAISIDEDGVGNKFKFARLKNAAVNATIKDEVESVRSATLTLWVEPQTCN